MHVKQAQSHHLTLTNTHVLFSHGKASFGL